MLPFNGQVPVTETTLYTVPPKRIAVIDILRCVNDGTVASSLAIYVTMRGTKTRLTPSVSLKAKGGLDVPPEGTKLRIPADGTISGVAGVADIIDYTISGVEEKL